jgi:hypothetical protein
LGYQQNRAPGACRLAIEGFKLYRLSEGLPDRSDLPKGREGEIDVEG